MLGPAWSVRRIVVHGRARRALGPHRQHHPEVSGRRAGIYAAPSRRGRPAMAAVASLGTTELRLGRRPGVEVHVPRLERRPLRPQGPHKFSPRLRRRAQVRLGRHPDGADRARIARRAPSSRLHSVDDDHARRKRGRCRSQFAGRINRRCNPRLTPDEHRRARSLTLRGGAVASGDLMKLMPCAFLASASPPAAPIRFVSSRSDHLEGNR